MDASTYTVFAYKCCAGFDQLKLKLPHLDNSLTTKTAINYLTKINLLYDYHCSISVHCINRSPLYNSQVAKSKWSL